MTGRMACTPYRREALGPLLLVSVSVGAIVVGALAARSPLLGVCAVAAAVYGLIVVARPAVGVLTSFALVPVTAGLRRGLPVPGLKLSEVVLLGSAVLVLSMAGGRRRWNAVDYAALTFVLMGAGVTGATLLRGTAPVEAEAIRSAFAPAVFFLLYRSVRAAGLTGRQRLTALSLLLAPAALVVLVALGQYFDVLGVRQLVESVTGGIVFERWSYLKGETGNRVTGLFEIWHSLAGYLVPLILLCLAMVNEAELPERWRRFAALMLGLTLVGLIASQTLNAIAVTLGGALLLGALQRRLGRTVALLMAASVLAAALVGPALVGRLDEQFGAGSTLGRNVEGRISIWSEDYADFLERSWAIGYGPGLPSDVEWDHTESLYVTLLLRGGIVLTGAFVLLFGVIIVSAWGARHTTEPVDRVVANAVFAVATGSIVMHAIFPYFTSSGFPQVFWLLLALLPSPVRRHPADVAADAAGAPGPPRPAPRSPTTGPVGVGGSTLL